MQTQIIESIGRLRALLQAKMESSEYIFEVRPGYYRFIADSNSILLNINKQGLIITHLEGHDTIHLEEVEPKVEYEKILITLDSDPIVNRIEVVHKFENQKFVWTFRKEYDGKTLLKLLEAQNARTRFN